MLLVVEIFRLFSCAQNCVLPDGIGNRNRKSELFGSMVVSELFHWLTSFVPLENCLMHIDFTIYSLVVLGAPSELHRRPLFAFLDSTQA